VLDNLDPPKTETCVPIAHNCTPTQEPTPSEEQLRT